MRGPHFFALFMRNLHFLCTSLWLNLQVRATLFQFGEKRWGVFWRNFHAAQQRFVIKNFQGIKGRQEAVAGENVFRRHDFRFYNSMAIPGMASSTDPAKAASAWRRNRSRSRPWEKWVSTSRPTQAWRASRPASPAVRWPGTAPAWASSNVVSAINTSAPAARFNTSALHSVSAVYTNDRPAAVSNFKAKQGTLCLASQAKIRHGPTVTGSPAESGMPFVTAPFL